MTTSSSRHTELYCARQLPLLQNQTYPTRTEAQTCATGDVILVQDHATGLIYNQAFEPERMHYTAQYQNEQGLSRSFRLHLEEMRGIIAHHFAGQSLLEVGCGKGFFLEMLQQAGFAITGCDPAYDGVNPAIHKRYFTRDAGLQADALILRHVLEHVPDPLQFLTNLAAANHGGWIYLEVPCLDWICRHRTWFDIYYEHVNYFRLSDFYRMFSRIAAAGHTFGGQYLYVVADLSSLLSVTNTGRDPFLWPNDFLATLEHQAAWLQNSPQAVIWGAGSKGVIFALFLQRVGIRFDWVIDINPAKQNTYLPVTGLRVCAPDEAIPQLHARADILVMNGNYLDEIQRATRNRFRYHLVDQPIQTASPGC
ncbi:MAG: methyltransferase domain-containing protein [Magnetococcales bacterium]|nr:methyltransferase domain-containing protein [Magnetococcales bacterium]